MRDIVPGAATASARRNDSQAQARRAEHCQADTGETRPPQRKPNRPLTVQLHRNLQLSRPHRVRSEDLSTRTRHIVLARPAPRARGRSDAAVTNGDGPILPFRLPGKTFGGFRAGYHQTPDHADGLITFAEYLGQSD